MNKLFFYNGNILTMDNSQKAVDTVVVKGNKIIHAGSYDSALEYIDSKTEYINLNGRTLLPGFNDSHMHLISYGFNKYKVDLRKMGSILELQKNIFNFINSEKTKMFNNWILGYGWNEENFKENRLPNKRDIDKVINDRPVFLSRACYHICVVNSKALEMAGIDKDTIDPEGGKIDRDPLTGEPTGILRENAIYLVYDLIPQINDTNKIKKLILSAIGDANKWGITSIQTDDFSHFKSYKKVIKAYEELKKENKLSARINLQLLLNSMEKLKDFLRLRIRTGDGDEWVRFGPLKLLADGSLGGRTAALKEPYDDDKTTRGILVYDDEELENILKFAYLNGLQPAVHAIGDRCMEQVLRIYEKLKKMEVKPVLNNDRFRIIHCQIGSNEIFKKFKELNVIADIQPIFLNTDLHIAEKRVGKDRIKKSYAWQTMNDMGVILSGSSDSPIESFNPLLGIYTAVNRKDITNFPDGGWYPEESLDLYTALKLFTKNPAYCTFEENIKGIIKPGMLADLVILSDNITKIDKSSIKDLKVDMTILNGKTVYERVN
ncbi:amidohydrolase [Thermohalobacter berrensis]|uniref:Amidohydrolase 3 domain-containing protein n=1 Tax=Thermohalobacter berrensis TaxID=99594 RepID=A0A419T557_9FIRM|nr:amidohydrolase [Thermohalobacter berrensis]RKD32575.1 hypothetical protein BET03_10900 [Thermohalobacter berrensis]